MNGKLRLSLRSVSLLLLLTINVFALGVTGSVQASQLATERQQTSQEKPLPELQLAQATATEQPEPTKQTPARQDNTISDAGLNQAEKVQVGQHTASNNLDAMSMILSLLMVLALIVGAALLLKRFQLIRPQSGQLKLVTSLHLSAKEKLVVVQVGEQQLLLGISGQQINLLHQLEQALPDDKMATGELGQNLSQLVGKYLGKGDSR